MRKRRQIYIDPPSVADIHDGPYLWVRDDERYLNRKGGHFGILLNSDPADDLIRFTPLYCRLGQTTAAQRRLFRSFNHRVRGPRKMTRMFMTLLATLALLLGGCATLAAPPPACKDVAKARHDALVAEGWAMIAAQSGEDGGEGAVYVKEGEKYAWHELYLPASAGEPPAGFPYTLATSVCTAVKEGAAPYELRHWRGKLPLVEDQEAVHRISL